MSSKGRTVKIVSIVLAVVLVVTVVSAFIFRERIIAWFLQPTESSVQEGTNDISSVEVVADGLETPWSITFLPEGDMLVTERSGQVKRIGDEGQTFTIDGVRETSEGGLLGITLHPEFSDNQLVYIYFTADDLTNQIDRYQLSGDTLTWQDTIIDNIPAASTHNGGAIAFGPDGMLYATNGDADEPDLAQDLDSLAGKILRLNDDGTIPDDNPFDSPVWSYGHRNPQGIAWDSDGQLWSVEHGQTARDELNRIERGANYGWPLISGDETGEGLETPVVQSGDTDTWAPAALGYHDGTLYFAGLRGQSLYEAQLGEDDISLLRHFTREYGRLRAVTVHDGYLYVSTSNRDGRGTPASDDDRILRIDPAGL